MNYEILIYFYERPFNVINSVLAFLTFPDSELFDIIYVLDPEYRLAAMIR